MISLEIVNSNGAISQETKSDLAGDFRFSGYFVNGRYLLRIKSPRYSGEQSVVVDKYLSDGVTLKAKSGEGQSAPMPASVPSRREPKPQR